MSRLRDGGAGRLWSLLQNIGDFHQFAMIQSASETSAGINNAHGAKALDTETYSMQLQIQIHLHRCKRCRGAPVSQSLAIPYLVVPHIFRLYAIAPEPSSHSISPLSSIANWLHSRSRGCDRWVWPSTPINKAKQCIIFRSLVCGATIRVTSISTDSV